MKAAVHLGRPRPKDRVATIRDYRVKITYEAVTERERAERIGVLAQIVAHQLRATRLVGQLPTRVTDDFPRGVQEQQRNDRGHEKVRPGTIQPRHKSGRDNHGDIR